MISIKLDGMPLKICIVRSPIYRRVGFDFAQPTSIPVSAIKIGMP